MKKKSSILVGMILIIFVFVIQMHYYETNYEVVNENTELSFTIDGEYSETLPSKESGLFVRKVICDNQARGIWDEETWSLYVKNLKNNQTKCCVHFGSKYEEGILNGTDPVLKEGLVPVKVEEDGKVYKVSQSEEWYSYENQEWANAVILEDEASLYEIGEEIPEDNIESYFVWIPRYRYKIFDDGKYASLTTIEKKEQSIEVIFENNDTPVSNGNTLGSWLTHPAFTSFGTNGMWVGKFETGYKGAANITAAQVNAYDTSKVEIKPNVYSWRNIQIANAYLNSYNYKREYDSHLMKNTEWGAVAYLQHSMYGSRSSVRINNNSSFITGYAAKNEPTTGYTGTNESGNIYESTAPLKDGANTYNYKNPLSVVASTTNNYSGVYDMSGGSWEYVMGVMMNSNGNVCSGRDSIYTSGFAGSYCNADGAAEGKAFPLEKYYDQYSYSRKYSADFNRRKFGDATGEMGPFSMKTYGSETLNASSWYEDSANFVYMEGPWFIRGGLFSLGASAGVFGFGMGHGDTYLTLSYRIVLAF